MAAIYQDMDSPAIIINGVADHVHALCLLSRTHAVADVISKVKSGSSKWLKTNGPAYSEFYWQGGYAVFSVSESQIETAKNYINHQKIRHADQDFKTEMRVLFNMHNVEFDERYVWE